MAARVVPKVCNLCEAMCGLRIHVDGPQILRIEADPDDPLSRGAICPKAIGLKEVQEDPDRLRHPLRRRGNDFEEISWDEALGETADRIADLQQRHGNDAVASYLGNPAAHNLGMLLALPAFSRVLDTRNKTSASSLDQNPKHAASILLFGNFLSIPVPDLDRTGFLLVLGANPVISGGSLMSAPGMKRRLEALVARGGRLVVVDPRRTETAELADQHVAIAPGQDGLLVAALVHTLLDEKLGRDGPGHERIRGLDELRAALAPFPPEAVAASLGLPAGEIRTLARDFAAASSAVAYGRVGTSQHRYGTLTTWLIDVLNLLTGNLDREGGAMFPRPAADLADLARRRGSSGHMARWNTRVRGAPCFNGEAPTACLREEITTPGEGQVRGLVTLAGNPVLSAPNGRALGEALAGLDFYAAIDFYLNETTHHAQVILPPTWSLEHESYELLFHGFAVRNTARFSPVVIAPEPGQLDDFAILADLSLRLAARKAGGLRGAGLGALRRLGLVPGPRRILDAMLRFGPYGDRYLPGRKGLSVAALEAAPSGVDLGPLEPRLSEVIGPDAVLDLAPEEMRAELGRLASELRAPAEDEGLLLIGRREMRTCNSWLHNTRMATKGRERCTLRMHPDDAERGGLVAGEQVRVVSGVGAVEVPLEITDELRRGVVSLPHGWGHRGAGLRMRVAAAHPGVSCNDLVDDAILEPVVGNAVFNGVPVRVESGGSRAARVSRQEPE